MYYGKQPQFEQYLTDSFTSDAVTYAAGYPLSYNPGLAQAIDVSVGGAVQRPNLDFTISGQTLSFSPTLPDGLAIFVKYLGVSGSSVSIPDASVTPVKIVETVLSKSVAGGSDVTLTANEAANSVYEFTGILTANINVIVPDTIRGFVVKNLTTEPFTLTVKTSAGTGVVCSKTFPSLVMCDGTNVFAVSTVSSQGAGTVTWLVKTTAYTAIAGDALMCDTSGGAFTITLPVAPVANDSVKIFDYSGTFNVNNLTIAGNGKTIVEAATYTCNLVNESRTLVYLNDTAQWRVM